jgi:hypothetical protein
LAIAARISGVSSRSRLMRLSPCIDFPLGQAWSIATYSGGPMRSTSPRRAVAAGGVARRVRRRSVTRSGRRVPTSPEEGLSTASRSTAALGPPDRAGLPATGRRTRGIATPLAPRRDVSPWEASTRDGAWANRRWSDDAGARQKFRVWIGHRLGMAPRVADGLSREERRGDNEAMMASPFPDPTGQSCILALMGAGLAMSFLIDRWPWRSVSVRREGG